MQDTICQSPIAEREGSGTHRVLLSTFWVDIYPDHVLYEYSHE